MTSSSVLLVGLTVASVAAGCERGPSTMDAQPHSEVIGVSTASPDVPATPDAGTTEAPAPTVAPVAPVAPAATPAVAPKAPDAGGTRPVPTITLPYKPKPPPGKD